MGMWKGGSDATFAKRAAGTTVRKHSTYSSLDCLYIFCTRPAAVARHDIIICLYTPGGLHAGTIVWSPPETISTATNAVSPPASWKVLPSLPSPQADNAAVYVQVQGRGYVYMSGGYHGYKYSPHYDHNLYRYDIAAARWQVVASGNFPGMVNNAIALDEQNHIFFAAGYSPDVNAIT